MSEESTYSDNLLKQVNFLSSKLEKLLQDSNKVHEQQQEQAELKQEGEELSALDLHFKICREMLISLENSFGDMQDMLDTLEYQQDKNYDELYKAVHHLEDLMQDLIAYLRKHNKY